MATLQVKGLDDGLYNALKSLAASENRSISQQVIALIKAALAHPELVSRRSTQAFLELAGTWEDPREPDEIAQDLRAARSSRNRDEHLLQAFDPDHESRR
jgi:plasmid stability protein